VLASTIVSPFCWKNRSCPAPVNCFWPMNVNAWSPSIRSLALTNLSSILSPCARLKSTMRSGAAGVLSYRLS
jgi:hypothetical protein